MSLLLALVLTLALDASPRPEGAPLDRLCPPSAGTDLCQGQAEPAWADSMKKVHAKFTGEKGTFACFGDSITVTMAFWAPLKYGRKNISPEGEAAYKLVSGHMKDECWSKWKGPEWGNNGRMTIAWAYDNIDAWLKKMNPEVALIMFGTNDLTAVTLEEYEAKTRTVVQK